MSAIAAVGSREPPVPVGSAKRLLGDDQTYVTAWQGSAYAALINAHIAQKIVAWRVTNNLRTNINLDALEKALWACGIGKGDQLPHHINRRVQFLLIRNGERLSAVGITPPVNSIRDTYDNAWCRPSMSYTRRRYAVNETSGEKWTTLRCPSSSRTFGTKTPGLLSG